MENWEKKFKFILKDWNKSILTFHVTHINSNKQFTIEIENPDILTNLEDIISGYLINIEKDIRDEKILGLLT